MQAKKNHILLFCILLNQSSSLCDNQTNKLEPETHNQELELDETVEENRKVRKIELPNRTNFNK